MSAGGVSTEGIGNTEHWDFHTFVIAFVCVCLSGVLESFRLRGSILLRGRRFGFVSIKLIDDAECEDSDHNFWYHRSGRRHLPNLSLGLEEEKKGKTSG